MELREDRDLGNLIIYDASDPICNPPLDYNMLSHQDKAYIRYGDGGCYLGHYSALRHVRYCKVHKLGVIKSMSSAERAALEPVHDRTFLVLSWVTQLIARRHQKEVFVAPPITSHLFSQLSAGHAAFMQAKKLVDTPFPFPYAQLNNMLAVVFAAVSPLGIVCWVEGSVMAFFWAFICVLAIMGLAEVNRELEDPFVTAPNELPLPYLHAEFNRNLCLLDRPWPHSLDRDPREDDRMFEFAMKELDRLSHVETHDLGRPYPSGYDDGCANSGGANDAGTDSYYQIERERMRVKSAAVRGGWAMSDALQGQSGVPLSTSPLDGYKDSTNRYVFASPSEASDPMRQHSTDPAPDGASLLSTARRHPGNLSTHPSSEAQY